MNTVVTVLDERKTSKHQWPQQGRLGQEILDRLKPTGKFRHCCLGCHALACDIPVDLLLGATMPSDTWGLRKSWVNPWQRIVPDAVLTEVLEVLPKSAQRKLYASVSGQYDLKAENLAAALNDDIASKKRWRLQAVKAIRILFAYVGKQQGEKWIIRHYQAK